MFNHKTQELSKFVILLASICLIGSTFHIHQFHPDYSLHDHDLNHHISVEKPDCIACLHLIKAPNTVQETTIKKYPDTDRHFSASDPVSKIFINSDLNNKSPPT
ncbi:hypothetical protein [Fodinibius saliphilus]|uniref:hypothetical protein n=1 Tax=Fodinibius saliphilus TaxID=1920650 RepID=UPI0011097965|nr:hypothetical protein [Fodinibius saliphilus]